MIGSSGTSFELRFDGMIPFPSRLGLKRLGFDPRVNFGSRSGFSSVFLGVSPLPIFIFLFSELSLGPIFLFSLGLG